MPNDDSEWITNPPIFSRRLPSIEKTSSENTIRNKANAMAAVLGIHIRLALE